MQEQIYLPVNWTDGMKINKTHFIAQENAFTSQLAQNAGGMLNSYNYGLLPVPGKHTAETKFFLSIDNQQQLQLRVQQYRAVTRGGYCINFPDETLLHANNLFSSISMSSTPFNERKASASLFYIILSINPYQRAPFGMADLHESPARIPWSVPGFSLSLVPIHNGSFHLPGLYQLPVGRLQIENEQAVLDTDYIPPCAAIESHPDLLKFHAALEQFYGKLETSALQVVQKILQKKQCNEMADIARKLSENIIVLAASASAAIKTTGQQQPPVYVVNNIAALARLVKNTLDCYIGSGKEEFINYCTEWCHTGRGELEGTTLALTNHLYDHLDINESVKRVSDFTKMLTSLFTSLAQLDYIGKRRDTGIFVKEQLIAADAERPARRSFLAD